MTRSKNNTISQFLDRLTLDLSKPLKDLHFYYLHERDAGTHSRYYEQKMVEMCFSVLEDFTILGFRIIRPTFRPFGFIFTIEFSNYENQMYQIYLTLKDYGWREIK
jgi:hypothetical protein